MAIEGTEDRSTTATPAATKVEAKKVDLGEAIEAAMRTVTGTDATSESVPAKKTTTEATDEAAAETPAENVEEAADGEAGEGDKEATGDTDQSTPKMYTRDELKSMKPGDYFDLDMERVPPDQRDFVRGFKALITREYQALAEHKGAREQQTSTDTVKQDDKKISVSELYDKAMDGPEGFAEAVQNFTDAGVREALSKFAEKYGLSEDDAVARQNDRIVNEAISLATQTFTDLSSDTFKAEVGKVMQASPVMAARCAEAVTQGNPTMLAMVVEQASAIVQSQRYKQTENARQAAKRAKETTTAKEVGSLAAESTTRGTSTSKGGPRTVSSSVDQALTDVGAKGW
jgi:hypothetical protein